MHEVNGCTGGQSLLAMASGDRSLAARLESPAAATHPLCQANERRIGVAASTFAEHSSVEHLRENGSDGISDVEGKVARVAMSELGNERISMLLAADLNRANRMSDIEHVAIGNRAGRRQRS